jgi:transcriptional regulator with XRE-family HTH domain
MTEDAAREARRQAAAKNLAHLGLSVRRLRRARNLTQESLAAFVGVDRRVIAYIEAGERDFGVSLLWPLAAGLSVPVSDLLGD